MFDGLALLSSPVVLLIVAYLLKRSGKRGDEKNEALLTAIQNNAKAIQTLVTKIDTLEDSKAVLPNLEKELTRVTGSLKELWNAFRDDQTKKSNDIGYLKGEIDG